MGRGKTVFKGLTKIERHTQIVLKGIHQRVKDKNNKYYGGKGIRICERWSYSVEGLKSFIEDMNIRPGTFSENGKKGSHCIDRIDLAGDYCKENCRWVTISESNKNRVFTEEYKHNNSNARLGNQFCLGNKLTEETKQKMRGHRGPNIRTKDKMLQVTWCAL